jgi:hypothetical protein
MCMQGTAGSLPSVVSPAGSCLTIWSEVREPVGLHVNSYIFDDTYAASPTGLQREGSFHS